MEQMRKKFKVALTKENECLDSFLVYSCNECRTHLTTHEDLISKCFQGKSGRAFLFHICKNIRCHQPERRLLLTGMHTVCDISCSKCNTVLGWVYIEAHEPSQKYKEGKFILEKYHIYPEDTYPKKSFRGIAVAKKDRFRTRADTWGEKKT